MNRLTRYLLPILLCASASAALGQAFNCPSGFSSSGACKVTTTSGSGSQFYLVFGTPGSLSGSQVLLMPTGETHQVEAMNWQQAVNVQAFTSSFTFIPNGQNVAFVLNNNTNTSAGGAGQNFSSGAGCESGFFQAGDSATPPWPNSVFALELDSYSGLDSSLSFQYSSAQIYQQGMSPCLPNDGAPVYYLINKVSTSPVPLDSPATTQGTTTGHVYSATIIYDGSNLTLNLFDVTAGGACPGSTCFTHTWTNINIPSLVSSTTAWVGLTAATGLTSTVPLFVNSFAYTANTPTVVPTDTAATANSTYNDGTLSAASPVFSPVPGSYSGTQSVTITSSTSGANICYILAASRPTLTPQTNNSGGCLVGTPYTGPISISSTQILYAMAGINQTGPPSTLVAGTYTINPPQPATLPAPSFLPGFGSAASPVTFNTPFSFAMFPAIPAQWVSGTAYALGALVCAVNSSGACPGTYYVSLQASNTGNALTNAAFWQTVTLSPTICYTLDGSTPTAPTAGTCSGGTTQTYSSPITLSGNVTINAIETQTGQTNSSATTFSFVIPAFYPSAGFTYVASRNVQLSQPQGDNVIYTTDGSTPTNNTGLCTALNGTAVANASTVAISSTTTVKQIGCVGGTATSVTTGVFTINPTATTYYIRPLGGTRFSAGVPTGQCNGTTDADYPGTGTNQNCAFNDFRYMWSDNHTSGVGTWIMAGGDTVIIRGCTALSGQSNPSNPNCRIGEDEGLNGNPPNSWCPTIGAGGCFNPPIPAGSSSQHTRILGQNWATCNTGGATDPATYESNLNQLFGGFTTLFTLNLKSTQYVDVQCLDVTSHNQTSARTAWSSSTTYTAGPTQVVTYLGAQYVSIQAGNTNNIPLSSPTFWASAENCTKAGAPSNPTGCNTGTPPVDDIADGGFATNQLSSFITFQDIYVHGFDASGFDGPIGPGIVMTRVNSSFNAFAHWDFDTGSPASTPNDNLSSINANWVISNWNGCYQEYPVVHAIPCRIAYDTNSQGFGDSWSGQNTTLNSFICNHCVSNYNTKDGFIGPHTWTATLTITNSESIGNMGQDWKWGGAFVPATVTFLNNLTVGNCNRLSQPFTGTPTGYNQYLTGFCRASGMVWGVVIPSGSTWTFANNTTITYQPTILNIGCPSALTNICTSTVNFTNNIWLGYNNPSQPSYNGEVPALYFTTGSLGINEVATYNDQFGTRNDNCHPQAGTGNICIDPLFVSEPAQGTVPPESSLDAFNFNLTSSSPAIGAGITYSGILSTDYAGNTQTSPPVIGALTFRTASLNAPHSFSGAISFSGQKQ